MADKRKTPESPGGGPRRKRTAPTIDLEATEVTDPATGKPEAAAPETPEPVAAETAPAQPTPESPEPTPEAAAAAPEPAAEEPAEPEPERAAPPPPPPPPRGGVGAGLTGGIIGALIIAALGAGAWVGGYIPVSSTQPGDVTQRVAALEKQVQALQNRPAPKLDTAVLDKSVAALSQRVSKLENDIGNLPPTDKAAAQRLAALDSAVKSANSAVASLGKRMDDIATTAEKAQQSAAAAQQAVGNLKQDVQNAAANAQRNATPSVSASALDALESRVAKLVSDVAKMRNDVDGQIKNLRGGVDSAHKEIAQAAAGDRATRLALSATALRNAVVSGAPYADQLAQARSLGADAKALAPLERFAKSGLPSRRALAGELSTLIPAMRKVSGAQKPTGSILERLQANAEKLVRITPVEAPAGSAPADVLARIEAQAAHADIAGALADFARLPDNVRAPAKDWIAKAKARQDALAAARSIAANAARALGKG